MKVKVGKYKFGMTQVCVILVIECLRDSEE